LPEFECLFCGSKNHFSVHHNRYVTVCLSFVIAILSLIASRVGSAGFVLNILGFAYAGYILGSYGIRRR